MDGDERQRRQRLEAEAPNRVCVLQIGGPVP